MPRAAARPSSFLRPTLFGLALGLLPPLPADDAVVLLRWRNGDELPGRLLEGGPGAIRFSARPFAAPFDLDPGQLEAIRFPGAADSADSAAPGPAPLFEVAIRNGDRLRGALLSVDGDRVVLRCAPLAEPVSIRRGEILRIARASGDGTGLSALGGLEDWTSSGRDRKPTDWFTDLRGELSTHQWSGNLYREIALPEKVEVRFRAHFPAGRPYVQIGLLRDPLHGPMLETWDDHLVLTHRTRFAPVMALDGETRELHFRLFWDQASGRVLLCDPSGRELASLTGTTGAENPDSRRRASDPLRRGFSILSRNPEMKLLSLEIRPWDGGAVPVIDLTRPRLQWRDGPARLGEARVALAPGTDRIQLGPESRPLDQLVEWILSPEAPATADAAERSTRAAWHSGTTLSGAFVRARPDSLELRPPWSDAPLLASLDGVREIRFPENPGPAAAGADTLAIDKLSLRGSVRLAPPAGGEGRALLAWQPPGAAAAAPFADGADLTIVRSPFADADAEPPVTLGQARLYLRDEEILAGELLSVDAGKVVFQSRATGRVEVPAQEVRAIDTGTAGRVLEGFRDSEWEENETNEEDVVLTPESVTMRNGGFGNPSLLLGDRVRFDAEWQESYGALTLRLFSSGPETGSPSTDVIIAAQGNRLFIGKLNESGAFSFSGDQIPIVNNRASVDLAARPDEIEVRVNGKSALTLEVRPDKISGNGIYFKMGGGWQGWNQADCTLVISRFRIDSSPGSVPRRVVDPRAKAHALSVPRSMRERPPTHLLLAPNGDLLRGSLESADSDSVRFHANGGSLAIPRARVSSIVRLDPPAPPPPSSGPDPAKDGKDGEEDPEEEGAAAAESPEARAAASLAGERRRALEGYRFRITHSLVLRDGTRLRLAGRGVEGARLAGESPVLGKCLVSLDQVRRIRLTPALPLEETEPMDPGAFHDWRAVLTPDPAIPDPGKSPDSPWVGKEAPGFELTLLDDTAFRLADHRGKVVVLDFWATWCGPCVKAMPEVREAVAAFPPGAVALVAVNQGETPPLVSRFLEARAWQDTPVALDFNMKVGAAYGVEGIPHTVVVDPAGRIAWVRAGFAAGLKKDLFEAIAKALAGREAHPPAAAPE